MLDPTTETTFEGESSDSSFKIENICAVLVNDLRDHVNLSRGF